MISRGSPLFSVGFVCQNLHWQQSRQIILSWESWYMLLTWIFYKLREKAGNYYSYMANSYCNEQVIYEQEKYSTYEKCYLRMKKGVMRIRKVMFKRSHVEN